MDARLWEELVLSFQAYGVVASLACLPLIALIALVPAVRRRPLPLRRLRPGGWNGLDVALALITFQFVIPVAVVVAFSPLAVWLAQDGAATAPFTIGFTFATTAINAVAIPLVLRHRAPPRQYGLTLTRWRVNVAWGVALFLVLAPATLAVNFLVDAAFAARPNPFENLVKGGIPEWAWILLVLMTMIAAPVVEEIVFRGILQGWLRRASLRGHILYMSLILVLGSQPLLTYDLGSAAGGPLGDVLAKVAPATRTEAAAPLWFTLVILFVYGIWLRVLWHRFLRDHGNISAWRPEPASPAVEAATEDTDEPRLPSILQPLGDPVQDAHTRAWAFANARLSVFGSAMLFALGHTHWPDPIPLLLLGVGLGWLAYRTQSLVGAIVCHALFNAVACFVLAWSQAAG